MKQRIVMLRLCVLAVVAMLIFAVSGIGEAANSKNPPAPTRAGGSGDGAPGTIYYGATPSGGGTNKPVLLFVQGMHGQANKWWTGGDDSYNLAYYAGYRTAFVDLNDAGGSGGSIWNNGAMLAGQINTIAGRYGVSGVNVIAHSKGGLDTNAAIVHYGAAGKVQNLAQLSSPNWGSQLADLSYSWWAGWLASILGQRDDAVYSLQTGQMSNFRALTDSRSENDGTRYFSSGGTNHGSLFGSLWFGGAYLSFYGDNDGAVTVSSAHHPRATWLFSDGGLTHDTIGIGHNYWSRVEPNVRSYWHGDGAAAIVVADSPYASLPAASILRGGLVDGTASESFPLESGVKALNVAVLTGPGTQVTLRDPAGKLYTQSGQQAAANDDVFKGAEQHYFQLDAPQPGNWQLTVSNATAASLNSFSLKAGGNKPNAYLMVAEPASSLSVGLSSKVKESVFAADMMVGFGLTASDGGTALTNLNVDSHLASRDSSSILRDGGTLNLIMPNAVGVHNLSLTVRGLDSKGYPFERSLTTSFAINK